jgi:hypothetical protein
LPEDSTSDIAEKKRRLAAAKSDRQRWNWRVAADLYIAAFLLPKNHAVGNGFPSTGTILVRWLEIDPLIHSAPSYTGRSNFGDLGILPKSGWLAP